MKCKKCGEEIKLGVKYCKSCGEETEYAKLKTGKLTIIRKSAYTGCAINFKAYVKEEFIGSIANGKTLTIDIPYGTYKVSFNKPNSKQSTEITIDDNTPEKTIHIKVKWGALIAKAKIAKVE